MRVPNKEKFNQLAKGALLKLGENPDHQRLYCLQLALVALEKGLVECLNDQLSFNLHSLGEWKPESAWMFLEGPEEHNLLTDLPENPKPEDLVACVLNQLDSRLSAEVEGYPRANEVPARFR